MKFKPIVIDLFSGCGGLSWGFEQAGYDVLVAVDHEPSALETLVNNHKNTKVVCGDISDEKIDTEIFERTNGKSVDVVIGGPPCQGFSLTGKRDVHDERNSLYNSFMRIVEKANPRAVLIENVPGIAALYGGRAKEEIINSLYRLGYRVSFQVLNSVDYGVPQVRKRAFFIGSKESTFSFPKPTHQDQHVTCEEAISDLPCLSTNLGQHESDYQIPPLSDYQKLMRKESEKLYNHVGTRHTDHVIDVISQVPEGGDHRDLPPGVGDSRKFNEAWTRYHSQKPSRTIDTGHRNHFHYKWNRVPTTRENARLQSFPDNFIFYGTKTQQNRQVGNAVPPLLATALAEEIKNVLIEEPRAYKAIDLFAGCGGLSDGFIQSGVVDMVAHVEWEKAPVETLVNRLRTKYNEDIDKVLHFDIQRTDELLNGWENDEKYGSSQGLIELTKGKGDIDLIIGGPPCQAYSIAGRVRDENGMRDDYRNYLFESYIRVVKHFRPKMFVFENVPGLLSAKPAGYPITERIQKAFSETGYEVINDLKAFPFLNLLVLSFG